MAVTISDFYHVLVMAYRIQRNDITMISTYYQSNTASALLLFVLSLFWHISYTTTAMTSAQTHQGNSSILLLHWQPVLL